VLNLFKYWWRGSVETRINGHPVFPVRRRYMIFIYYRRLISTAVCNEKSCIVSVTRYTFLDKCRENVQLEGSAEQMTT